MQKNCCVEIPPARGRLGALLAAGRFIRLCKVLAALALTLAPPAWQCRAAPGDLDLSFQPGSGFEGRVFAIAVQPDGKVVVGGTFQGNARLAGPSLTRLNPDGSQDVAFNPGSGADDYVLVITLQPDGKVLVGGSFTSINGINRGHVARLNTDGSLDASFNPGIGADGPVLAFAVQADGKVLIGGAFRMVNGVSRANLARLNADGSLDAGFAPVTGPSDSAEVRSVALQPDGKILVGGLFAAVNGVSRNGLARLNADGGLDGSLASGIATGPNVAVDSVVVQSDGKVVIGGQFTTINGASRMNFARLNHDGSVDTTFNPGLGADGYVWIVAAKPDGKVLIGGQYCHVNGASRTNIAQLNADGSVDAGFDPGLGTTSDVYSLAWQPDGKVVIGGIFLSVNGTDRHRVARLNPDGKPDPAFNPGSAGVDFNLGLGPGAVGVLSLAAQPDGKALIGGRFLSVNGISRTNIARLDLDGNLDASFDPGSGANDRVWCVALQSDGKALAAGAFTAFNGVSRKRIARLNPDGSLDAGFDPGRGANNDVYSLALQPDDKVVIGGLFSSVSGASRNRIARLNPNGSLDGTFRPDPSSVPKSVLSVVLQPDGKVLAGGAYPHALARLNPDGSTDTSFNQGTGPNDDVSSVALQPDGKVVIGGRFLRVNGVTHPGLARLNADGSLDFSFNQTNYDFASTFTIGLEADGKVLAGGAYPHTFARFNPDGRPDAGFQAVLNDEVRTMAFQPGGKLLVGGRFTHANGLPRWGVARLIAGEPPVITLQPVGRTNDAGASATFTVAATSADPLSYQWLKNGTNLVSDGRKISGAAGATLTLSNLQKDDEGFYSVVVGNAFDSVTSSRAFLRVNLTPQQAVEGLISVVNKQATQPQALRASLDAALASIRRGNTGAAIQQLEAFQNKVRAQVGRQDPTLAAALIRAAQEVIEALRKSS